jgi:hypothetical protein
MQNATFLFPAGYFTRLCRSSHLISFNYKSTAKNVGVPGYRNFVVFFHENLAAIRNIASPRAVQVKRVGRKAEYHTNGIKEHSSNQL